jgi:hypothetical protein
LDLIENKDELLTAEENSKNKIKIDKLERLHKPSSSKPYQIFIQ